MRANCCAPVHVRQHFRVLRALGQLKASLTDLEGPQSLATRIVRIREIGKPVKVVVGLPKFLTQLTNAFDGAQPPVRGVAVLDSRNHLLRSTQCELESHTIGIIRQSFERLQSGLESARRFAIGRSIRRLLRRGLRIVNRPRIIRGKKIVTGKLGQMIIQPIGVKRLDREADAFVKQPAALG